MAPIPRRPRVVVAGAGVMGSACALSLARAGAQVVVADPAPLGANASSVAAGMLAPAFEALFDPESPPFDLMRRARDLWPTLAGSAGVHLERHGALAVGAEAEVEEWTARLERLDAAVEILSSARLADAARWLAPPRLKRRPRAVFTGEDWRVPAGPALASLHAAALDLGARFAAAAVIDWTGDAAILSDGTAAAADALVIATGASHDLVAVAPELARLAPIKGHILHAPAVTLSGPVVRLAGLYVCPDAAGALIGATMEPGIADPAVDPAVAEALASRLAAAAPVLAAEPPGAASWTARAGVRAATPDSLPLAGPSATPPGVSGVWLATGARRNGWLLAPLIAETVTRGILGMAPSPWATLMAPGRFTGGA